jgi:UDP-N-acetylglucosamine:LPS N-acetylglucosamine transferase
VFIALGGGPHGRLASRIGDAIAARNDDVDVRLAGGFDSQDGLASELAAADVAVLAGGVTLYEACALGVPVIAVALNPHQHTVIRAMDRLGAALDGGRATDAVNSGFSRKIERLLTDAALRRRLSATARRLVDGQGAFRVAERLRGLTSTRGPT